MPIHHFFVRREDSYNSIAQTAYSGVAGDALLNGFHAKDTGTLDSVFAII